MTIETSSNYTTRIASELVPLMAVLEDLRKSGKISIAVLYGSFARGTPHRLSDIDLALFLNPADTDEEIELTDRILMSIDRDIFILRLDDDNESPFIVQEALKGIHLVEPDRASLYRVWHWALHESESIRFGREAALGWNTE